MCIYVRILLNYKANKKKSIFFHYFIKTTISSVELVTEVLLFFVSFTVLQNNNVLIKRKNKQRIIVWQTSQRLQKPFSCDVCPDKSYSHRVNLYRHKRVECNKAPAIQCTGCYRKFYYRSAMETHYKNSHNP